jgi:hypothetical protein
VQGTALSRAAGRSREPMATGGPTRVRCASCASQPMG